MQIDERWMTIGPDGKEYRSHHNLKLWTGPKNGDDYYMLGGTSSDLELRIYGQLASRGLTFLPEVAGLTPERKFGLPEFIPVFVDARVEQADMTSFMGMLEFSADDWLDFMDGTFRPSVIAAAIETALSDTDRLPTSIGTVINEN